MSTGAANPRVVLIIAVFVVTISVYNLLLNLGVTENVATAGAVSLIIGVALGVIGLKAMAARERSER